MPSPHVWSKLDSSGLPQFLNQAPPRAQQLTFPDFLIAAHLVHVPDATVVAAVLVEVFPVVVVHNFAREPSSIWSLRAVEVAHAPQSAWANDAAW